MSDIAVNFKNVSKFYKLYNDPKDRLKEALHPFGRKYHREFYALRNINLEVRRGEILGIVGRNGSGKSTLLKLISRVIQPSSGKLVVKGKVSALLELGSGMSPDFTGIQNIYFSGIMMGFTREEMKEKIDDIVGFADIGDFIHQPLKTYSSGMKTRLGFALAINMEPEILILDEVLAVGVDLFRRKCYAKMEEFFAGGCTVLYVSHSMSSVNEICTRAVLLDKGELILEGSPELVTMHYQKHLFATPENADNVRNEIIQLNQDEDEKRKFVKSKGKTRNEKKTKADEVSKIELEMGTAKQEAYYIPKFKPKSTIEYKNYDVEFKNMHIKTLDDRKVNVLVVNEEYIYCYKARFNIDAKDVSFGVRIKTTTGYHVSGSALHFVKTLESVKCNDLYDIRWNFKCTLLPGDYYITMGVSSIIDNQRVYLNRIEDAFVFRVQKMNNSFYTGIVHLNQRIEVKKVEKYNKYE